MTISKRYPHGGAVTRYQVISTSYRTAVTKIKKQVTKYESLPRKLLQLLTGWKPNTITV
jgi:hypothetical protein